MIIKRALSKCEYEYDTDIVYYYARMFLALRLKKIGHDEGRGKRGGEEIGRSLVSSDINVTSDKIFVEEL